VRQASKSSRGRRTWPQRLILSLNVVLIVAALGTAAALGYGYEKVGNLPRISFEEGVLAARDDGDGATDAVNVLLVGTDSGAGLDPDDPVLQGRPSSKLADVLMILRLEPETGDAALLSIPRDLWVPIAGTSGSSKINAAYGVGGAPALIETITDYLGIPIHHFVEVDFAGFRAVVEAIGGVEVYFPYPARDLRSHLDVPEAGCQMLDPPMALAYARSRYYDTYQDGEWERDPTSDFGRMQRQQSFMRLALSRAIEQGARNPVTLNALVNAVDDAVVLDEDLSTGLIVEIANAFRLFDPEALGGYTLQDYVTGVNHGGESALELREGEAAPLLDLFRGVEGLAPTPETVRISVVNASGESDQASAVADDLRLAGFVVRSTDNADEPLSRTEVRYVPGQRAAAELVARYLVTPPTLVEVAELREAPVVLATASDYAGLLAQPRDEAPGTSTGTPTSTTPTTLVPSTDLGGDADEESVTSVDSATAPADAVEDGTAREC
jgi:polyisoprenyl-teichoic acid--peptidoglycan teichoic acid transferase